MTLNTIRNGKTTPVDSTAPGLAGVLAAILEAHPELSSATTAGIDGTATIVWRDLPVNVEPTADLTLTVNGLTVTAKVAATDPDGGIASQRIYWGDGNASNVPAGTTSIPHAYTAAGTFTVTLSVVDTDGATTTATSTVTLAPPAPTAKFPGDVQPGHVRWGASVGGNSDVVARHETPAGTTLGVHRTFFAGDNQAGMVNMAKDDLAHGRVPWLSFKPFSGSTWASIGAGQQDAKIDALLKALGALAGPVWLTFHHEPENDPNSGASAGGAPAWLAAQKRIRARITATGVKNIAFASILMSWTFDPRSGRKPADWWADGVWDFAGIDHYVDTELATSMTVNDPMWPKARAFYTTKGLKIALGEWGNRGTDAQAAKEMSDFYDLAVTPAPNLAQIIAQSYFDSGLNSATGSWELLGAPLVKFQELMKRATSIHARES